MASKYEYLPLKSQRSIRAFTILPSRDRKAPVQGTICETNLDSNPSFEALSYVWGASELGNVVTILSQSTDSTKQMSCLQVTPNCLSALQAMRLRFRSRKLWIDAICIDQASTAEKSQQVPLMAEIFGRAKQVLLWLNPGNQDKKRVQQTSRLIRRVGWLYRTRLLRLYGNDDKLASRMPKNTKLVMTCEKYVDSNCQKMGDSFNAPFLNQYFQRVWTVQEIAMAHSIRVRYGATDISWRDFVVSGLFAARQGGFLMNQEVRNDVFLDSETHWSLLNALGAHFVLLDIYAVEALHNRRNKGNILSKCTPSMVESTLLKSKVLNATEPKDKAYAMLWLFPDSSDATDPLRRIDYDKPMDVIFTEYSTAIFAKTKGSVIQFYWVNTAKRDPSLPSWVPDWNENTSMAYYGWANRLKACRATKAGSERCKLEIKGRLLRLSGLGHGRIKTLIRLHEETRHRNLAGAGIGELLEALIDTRVFLKCFIDKSRTIISPYDEGLLEAVHRIVHSQQHLFGPGPEDQLEFLGKPREVELSRRLNISIGLLRVRVFDKLTPLADEHILSVNSLRTTLEQFLVEEEVGKVVREAQTLTNLPPFFAVVVSLWPYIDLYRFLHIFLQNHRDKDFFITDKGNMGIAFQGLKAGDEVVLWKGFPSPFIVRKIDRDGRDAYQLHGPAYIDGIMNGEAWTEEERDLRVFELV